MMAVPPSLTDPRNSFVKYQLFPKLRNSGGLEQLHLHYMTKLSSFLLKYIWQNEPISLRGVNRDDGELCLEGLTDYADNIEDEWFIVFLLHHLTKEDKDLVVRIEDSDGEFLLIEAADHLPKWVNPETCENRVFLYQGALHIVPLANSPAEITTAPGGVPSIQQALLTVRTNPDVTKASPAVQEAILSRIKGYPEKISELQHRAHCYVPYNLASILAHNPALISPAVSAFYHRDPIDLKACRAMKYFPPETRVMTEVIFTRCLYAQLVQQKFCPDSRTGWNLPNARSPSYLSHNLGMKLACGFEILASRSASKDISSPSSGNSFDTIPDLTPDTRWMTFVESLTKMGYFNGELEGSRLYKDLLQKASQFYVQSVQPEIALTASNSAYVGSQILSLLRNIDIDYEKLKEAEKHLSPPDDDSWLDLTPDLLESILEEYSNRTGLGENPAAHEDKNNLGEAITSTLHKFIDGASGLEGVDTSSCRRTHNVKKGTNKVDFDEEGFADVVRSILHLDVPESDSQSSSSMSGYSDEDDVDEIAGRGEKECSQPPKRPPRKKDKKVTASLHNAVEGMEEYMAQMDRELAATDVGQSFERTRQESSDDSRPVEEECDTFQPVDIDLTALRNILESYSSQGGLPGPASTLLQSMGLNLPQDSDEA